MNSEIKLNGIKKEKNRIIYNYETKGDMSNYLFKDNPFLC